MKLNEIIGRVVLGFIPTYGGLGLLRKQEIESRRQDGLISSGEKKKGRKSLAYSSGTDAL